MSIKKTLLKNSSINLLGYCYLLVLSFFSVPIFLKSLGTNLFGVYLIYAGMVPLVSTLNLGLTTALVRYLSLPTISKKQKTHYWQTCFWQFIILSIIVFFISLVLNIFVISKLNITSFLPRTSMLISSFLISLIIFVNHLNQPLMTLPQVDQKFIFYNLRTLIVGSGNTILSALLSIYYPSLPHIFAFQLVPRLYMQIQYFYPFFDPGF